MKNVKAMQPAPAKPKKLAPNLDQTGRLIRGLGAAALFIGGLVTAPTHIVLSLIFFASGGFVLFEAWRGWCALRACGIKTKF